MAAEAMSQNTAAEARIFSTATRKMVQKTEEERIFVMLVRTK